MAVHGPATKMKLSIIIPAYNEAATIVEVIRRAQAVPLPCEREIIVVDDGSTDRTMRTLMEMPDRPIVSFPAHHGKGAAIQEGLDLATGDYVCTLDADLELAPEDIPRLLTHNIAVSGVRKGRTFANRLLSRFLGQHDICCGLKVIRTDVLRSLNLKERGFGFECELTIKLQRAGYHIIEVPVSY